MQVQESLGLQALQGLNSTTYQSELAFSTFGSLSSILLISRAVILLGKSACFWRALWGFVFGFCSANVLSSVAVMTIYVINLYRYNGFVSSTVCLQEQESGGKKNTLDELLLTQD